MGLESQMKFVRYCTSWRRPQHDNVVMFYFGWIKMQYFYFLWNNWETTTYSRESIVSGQLCDWTFKKVLGKSYIVKSWLQNSLLSVGYFLSNQYFCNVINCSRFSALMKMSVFISSIPLFFIFCCVSFSSCRLHFAFITLLSFTSSLVASLYGFITILIYLGGFQELVGWLDSWTRMPRLLVRSQRTFPYSRWILLIFFLNVDLNNKY